MKSYNENLAKAFYDVGKLIFAALAIGPIISERSFEPWVFTMGVASTIIIFVIAYAINRKGDM